MGLAVSIHQPNYAPWCGYFAKIRTADVFVFLDDVQMSKGSYTSRCQIRNGAEVQWLSVPVRFHLGDLINQVQCGSAVWPRKHLQTLQMVYGRCPYFADIMDLITPAYESAGASLSSFNMQLVRRLADYLGLERRFEVAGRLAVEQTSDDRLVSIVKSLGGTRYISGKGGVNYQDPEKFRQAGIELDVRSYHPVPYPQIHGEFIGGLSILDALFHVGREATELLVYRD